MTKPLLDKSATRFIKRVAIVATLAPVLGLGIRVVLESRQLSELVPPSTLRDILLFLAPLVVLAERNYTLAVKSFGMKALHVELGVLAASYSFFLALTAPAYWGTWTTVPVEECARWILSCPDNERLVVSPYMMAAFLLVGACFLAGSVRAGLRPRTPHVTPAGPPS